VTCSGNDALVTVAPLLHCSESNPKRSGSKVENGPALKVGCWTFGSAQGRSHVMTHIAIRTAPAAGSTLNVQRPTLNFQRFPDWL
jgi:hypothetical protein